MKIISFLLLFFFLIFSEKTFSSPLQLVRIKYSGGGDWYNDPEVLPNLAKEIEKRTDIKIIKEQKILSFDSPEIFDYPFLYLTGHGNIILSSEEKIMLRRYLTSGGFLYIDDDYGLDKYIRKTIKELYPNRKLHLVSTDNPIFKIFYDMKGLPKIHKHDGKPAQAYAIFDSGRMVLFYTYESNISDGWADPETHGDPPNIREQAFKMGINIFLYAIFRK